MKQFTFLILFIFSLNSCESTKTSADKPSFDFLVGEWIRTNEKPDRKTYENWKKVDKNTFFLAMYGATAGISAITKISGAINQAVLAIVNDRKVSNNYFLLNFFELKKDWIIDTYTQGGQPNLNADIVKKISIPLPPLSEQEKIAEVLSDTDLWIESTEALLAKKRQIKKGAMQKLLSPKEDWEVRKLGEVCDYKNGKGLEKLIVKNGKLKILVGNTACLMQNIVFPTLFYKIKTRQFII